MRRDCCISCCLASFSCLSCSEIAVEVDTFWSPPELTFMSLRGSFSSSSYFHIFSSSFCLWPLDCVLRAQDKEKGEPHFTFLDAGDHGSDWKIG